MNSENYKITVIGLGYVGLPLAVEFGKKFHVLGFDINQARVDALNGGHDATLEVEDEDLQAALTSGGSAGLKLTTSLEDIKESNIYIVTVPTAHRSVQTP